MRTRQRIEGSYGALLLLVLGLGVALACSGDSPTAPVQQPGPPPTDNQPVASFSSENLASSTTVVFTNQSNGASSFEWDFGDGLTSTDASPVHEYSVVGDYVVTLTASSALFSSEVVKQIEVGVRAEFRCICGNARNTLRFVNTSQNSNLHEWTFGDGGSSKGLSPYHKFFGPGEWNVQLVATRGNQEAIAFTTAFRDEGASCGLACDPAAVSSEDLPDPTEVPPDDGG